MKINEITEDYKVRDVATQIAQYQQRRANAAALSRPRYSVAEYEVGGDVMYIVVTRDGRRASVPSGVNMSYNTRERAEEVADDLNAGNDGFLRNRPMPSSRP